MDKLILLVGKNYRVLTPEDVNPIIENVISTVNDVLPIALMVFAIFLFIDLIPKIIELVMDKEFRNRANLFISTVYNALVARFNITKK